MLSAKKWYQIISGRIYGLSVVDGWSEAIMQKLLATQEDQIHSNLSRVQVGRGSDVGNQSSILAAAVMRKIH